MLSKFTGVAAATAVGVSATVAGAQSAAVQWRVEDGGNGHWYDIRELPTRPRCSEATAMAEQAGARLIALETAQESDFFRIMRCSRGQQHLSGWQDLRRVDGVWVWGSGAAFGYESWSVGQPDSGDTATIDWSGPLGQCDTLTWGDEACEVANLPSSLFLEWSADCNNDGIVDYGQILDGTFTDANSNGIPDSCDCLGDIDDDGWIDGVDLGGVLAAWGKAPAGTPADLNGDGAVDGTDLGVLLAGWGACAP